MKRILFIIIAIGISSAVAAQEGSGMFIGIGTGMNFGFDGYEFVDRPNSHNGAGFAGEFYLGGWLGNEFGLRLGYQGFGISDCYTDFGKYGYSYFHGDALFRLWRHFVPYIHIGGVKVVNPGFAGGAGLVIPVRMGKRINLIPDLRVNVYDSQVYGQPQGNIAATISGTIGFAVRLGTIREKPKPKPVIIYEPRFINDTIVIPEVIIDQVHDTTYVYQQQIEERRPETITALALFDTGKYNLRPEVLPELDKIAQWFFNHPGTKGSIEGHTDNTSSATYNLKLSKNRAKAVYDYLVLRGVSPLRLKWEGYGLTRPIADNSTPEGRQLNRRVEINVTEN